MTKGKNGMNRTDLTDWNEIFNKKYQFKSIKSAKLVFFKIFFQWERCLLYGY